MTTLEVVEMLNGLVEEAGSQNALAARMKISPMYLSDVLRCRREPGKKLLERLGLVRVVTYEPTKHGDD